jgi:acetate kinase
VNVLAINCGSSSLKWALLDREDHLLAEGTVDVAGNGTAAVGGGIAPGRDGWPAVGDHTAAAELVLATLDRLELRGRIDAVGHRVVHGGSRFAGPVLVDDIVLAAIDAAAALAPLHNRPALDALRAISAGLASVPAVVTFDTAFHRTMPDAAAHYPIDPALTDRHGIRRYGFHGLAHRSMVERYASLSGGAGRRLVTLQLGGGCSAAAIDAGRCLDTSMGLTPLEGLMMATRSGDVDPSLAGVLARAEGVAIDIAEGWLSHRAGLLGVSGRSRHFAELVAADDRRARLAVDMFCHRARKYLGAYLAVLGGADAVVFGGGIGEHVPEARRRICERMDWCGLRLDGPRNEAATGGDARISADRATIEVWVVAVDEQRVVATDTRATLAPPGS